jgi:hypothetical protein
MRRQTFTISGTVLSCHEASDQAAICMASTLTAVDSGSSSHRRSNAWLQSFHVRQSRHSPLRTEPAVSTGRVRAPSASVRSSEGLAARQKGAGAQRKNRNSKRDKCWKSVALHEYRYCCNYIDGGCDKRHPTRDRGFVRGRQTWGRDAFRRLVASVDKVFVSANPTAKKPVGRIRWKRRRNHRLTAVTVSLQRTHC